MRSHQSITTKTGLLISKHSALFFNYQTLFSRDEDDDDEDGFNDVEEITDDMCEVSHDVSGDH